jgi:vancomycin resistance protein YoaR
MSWGWTAALLAVAILVSAAATLFITELWLADRVLPGVQVWDVQLGGATRDQAMERLAAGFRYPEGGALTLRYGDQAWPVQLEDLGAHLDLEATVGETLSVGHRGDLLAQLAERVDVLLTGHVIMPRFTANEGDGALFLAGISRQVRRPLRDAALVVGDDLSVHVVPGEVGRQVDAEATLEVLLQRIESMAGGEVELVVRETHPHLIDLSAAQAQAERILSGPVVLTSPGFDTWSLEAATLAGWLALRPTVDDADNVSLSVSLDDGQVSIVAEEIATTVYRSPVDAQFRFDPAQTKLVSTVQSVPGRSLDVEATVALVESAATSDQRRVELPLVEIPPAISTEDGPSLGIVELLGEGKTSYAGSTVAREQNIVVGTAQFDGLLIPPGETFSFNRYLGEVTEEKGYEKSIIIWGNTTRADVGGGLCQVSSTAFRAAFWAGVPITERHAHAFRVSYYEPPKGLDATIYSPSVDLKWVNDTGYHILVQTNVNQAKKTVAFRYYGTNPGHSVEMDGPHESRPVPHGPDVFRDDPTMSKGKTKQIEWAKDGLDVTVHRIIKEDGVEVSRDTFFSRYRPWQAVYLVGTKE